MVRQARTYFAGAVSGTALIAAAVVAFVLLVSLQTLRDWPLAGIGGGSNEESGAVAPARSTGSGGPAAAGQTGAAGTAPGATARGDGSRNATTSPTVSGAPLSNQAAEAPAPTPAGSGGGSAPSQPAGSPARGDAAAGASGGGGGNGSSGNGPATSGGGGSGGGANSVSKTVTGTVNETVAGVDQATGGALGQTGVPKATEEIVDGVAGPESTVGKTVDKTVEAVGGLLGGGH